MPRYSYTAVLMCGCTVTLKFNASSNVIECPRCGYWTDVISCQKITPEPVVKVDDPDQLMLNFLDTETPPF